jgi:Domain of unknown function (DUF4349)
MSQRDLVAELRAARIEAPANVRARVRLIAAADTTPPHRRVTWRRALVVALPVAAAIAAAVIVTRPSHHENAVSHGAAIERAAVPALGAAKAVPAPSTTRVQRYGATLRLRVADPGAVSNGVTRAIRIARSLGGYESAVHTNLNGDTGAADLTLRIPRANVQQAVARLTKLGTVTSEQVDITDLTAGLNATDRTIARLQRRLAQLRAQNAPAAQIAALTARIQRLQRAESTTTRAAHYATVRLHLGTPPHVASHHYTRNGIVLGVCAIALLLVGWLAARTVRRRREDALLSRS